MWPTGLWPSPPILGWPPESCMGASPTTPDTFSSSRRFKHAALGFRLRSDKERESRPSQYEIITNCVFNKGEHDCVSHVLLADWPLTCCSKLRMTLTAWCRMRSLVWGLSWLRCSWHILPSSLNASLMSRTLRRSRALLATRRSLSRSIFTSGGRSSSSSSGLFTNGDEMMKLQAGGNFRTHHQTHKF